MGPSLPLFRPQTVHQPKEYRLVKITDARVIATVFLSAQVGFPGICLGYHDLRTGER